MATVSILNTTSNVSGKTVIIAENAYTVTGEWTFDRDPNPPFAVSGGSAVVPNLDADKVDGKHSTDFLLLDGTQAMTAGIQFPASQNASSGANTLDDYEEGSWTPAITGTGGGSGQTYGVQVGRYIKIGKKVFFQGRITLTALGTVTTQAAISGLPFTCENTTNAVYTVHIGYFNNFTSSFSYITGLVNPNTTIAPLYGTTGGTGVGGLVQGDLANTSDIIFSGFYRATA